MSISIVSASENVNESYSVGSSPNNALSVGVNVGSGYSNNLSTNNVGTNLVENTVGANSTKNTVINAPNVDLYYKNGTRFIATLSDIDGNKLANQTLIFSINGFNYTRITNNEGSSSIAINLNPNTYNCVVLYNGDKNYSPSTKTSTVTVYPTISGNNITKYFRNATQYTAKFLDNYGQALTNTSVSFNINGVFYVRKTNSDGVAKLNINLEPNTYILTAIHPVSGYQYSNIVKVLPTIYGDDIVKVYMDPTQYVAKFLSGDGSPLKNTAVTFNINGVFYTRTTDSDGYARLNIRLSPNDYIITDFHPDGSRLSNNIRVIGSSTTTINTTNYEYRMDDTKTINATLLNQLGYGIADQNLIITVNGNSYTTITNSDGVASTIVNLTKQGVYQVNYKYDGTSTYQSSSATSTINVKELYDTIFVVNNTVIYYKNSESFDVTVLTDNNVPVASQPVYFTINGITYKRTTNDNGIAKLNINLDPGNYNVSYKFNTTNYKELTQTSKISVINGNTSTLIGKNTTVAQGLDQQFQVTLKVGDVPLPGRTVILNINGINYTRTTNDNGIASITIRLNQGKYLINYYYNGEERIKGSSGQAYLTVIQRKSSSLTWSSATSFTTDSAANLQVTLKDSSNKAISNAKVTFTVSSKNYVVTTNSNGVASLSQSLSAGSYSISYSYDGDNNYLPSSGATQIFVTKNGDSNGYGYWVQGRDMASIDSATLAQLASLGTTEIFLNFYAFTVNSESAVLNWIKLANANNINVHIWMQAFYNGGWVNPISGGSINQAYFNEKISEAKYYASLPGVSGVHLDYLRYPGTAYKTSGGTAAITEFAKQVTTAIHSVNSNLIVSAAVMPETTNDKYYYGQDIPALSKILDVIVPMQYKGNYNTGTSWIGSTTRWFVQNSYGAEIWSGLQAYVSDDDLTKLIGVELTSDAQTAINNGATGVMLFRYGLSTFLNFNNLDDPSYGSTISVNDVLTASGELKNYIESNYELPSKITVGSESYTIPQMLAIMGQTIQKLNGNWEGEIVALLVSNPENSTGDVIYSQLNASEYLKVVEDALSYCVDNNIAPNNVNSSIGKIKYETLVYMESRILSFYNSSNRLPASALVNNFLDNPTLTVNMLPSVSSSYQYVNYTTTWLNYCPKCGYYGTLLINPKHVPEGELTCYHCDSDYCGVTGKDKLDGSDYYLTRLSESVPVSEGKVGVNVSVSDIVNAAVYLKGYYEDNSDFPDYIVLPEGKYTLPEFLYLMGKAIVQINAANNNNITIIQVESPSTPSGDVINGTLSKEDYLDVANRVANFISNNNLAPNYASSTLGKIAYPELLDSFSRILNYYSAYNQLPTTVKIVYSSSSSKSISELAKSLTNGLTSERDKAVALYNYVRDQISYSFYYNTQKGAEGTLTDGSGNCCDQAQLLVAMARAVNLTVRFATGYCTFSSGSTYGHVWAQFLINGAWINADPTSTRNSFGVINNWNTGSYTSRGTYDVLPY
ncbi:MAG: Ig-like domain repeat protein [Methanobrevibacter sp.]|nr:Ig-like domain repeat protein [Methanobrevibacter sp.]